jgi:hypothetical protein
MFARLFIAFCLLVCLTSRSNADGPIEVVHRLTDAIRKGEKAGIAPFYLAVKDRPLDLSWIDSLLASQENDFISPTWCFDAKTNNDAAAVVVGSLKRRNLDLDPCYMVRLAGEWRILPLHTDIEIASSTVSDPTMKALQQVAAWYKSRKPALLAELGKELEATWKKPAPPGAEEARKHMIEIFSKRDPKGHPTSRAK